MTKNSSSIGPTILVYKLKGLFFISHLYYFLKTKPVLKLVTTSKKYQIRRALDLLSRMRTSLKGRIRIKRSFTATYPEDRITAKKQCFGSIFIEPGSRQQTQSGPGSRKRLNPDPICFLKLPGTN